MKARLSVFILLLALLPSAASAFDDALVAAARKEGKVVFYSSAAIEATQKICQGFERAYSGVKCEFYRATALPLFQRFNTEMEVKNIKADVIHASSVPGFLNARDKGWLVKYKSPEGAKYLPQFKDKEGYFVAARVIPMGIAYNNKLISAAEATVGYFAGDGLMVYFNDPIPSPEPAAQAVRLAISMRERMEELLRTWGKRGHELGFGVGIDFGYATLGEIGFEGRRDYGVIGTVVNLASRLSDEAASGEILLSQRAYAAVEQGLEVEPAGEFTLKGIVKPVTAYRVITLKGSMVAGAIVLPD